jgi:cyclophilin family peptidyl-prolyl cis-trans isomerase
VGTEKRERQKANRQVKLEEMARTAQKQKKKRLALRVAIGIPLALAAVYGLVWAFNSDGKSSIATPAASSIATDIGTIPANSLVTPAPDGTSLVDSTTTTAPPETVAPITTITVVTPSTQIAGNLPCPPTDGSEGRVVSFPPVAPPTCIDRTKTYSAEVTTNQGVFTIEFDAQRAPITVNSFVYLARYHYFDNVSCHRLVPDFVVQCGDPQGDGQGGPGYEFADELPAAGEYKIGSIVMANSGPDTNGSQFFIVTGDKGVALPPKYALFGQVTNGLDTTITSIAALALGDNKPSIEPVFIKSVVITES